MNRRFPKIRPFTVAVVAALVVTAATVSFVSLAGAQTGCSGIDQSGTECSITDALNPRQPEPGGTILRVVSSPPGPRFVWLNLLVTCDAATSTGWTSITDLASAIFDVSLLAGAGDPDEPGVLWIGELIDPATGGTNTGYISCVGVGSGLPALPPPLPTAADFWDTWGAALTVEPEVHLDPYVRGLTGLETHMWYEGPVDDTVPLTLNGYGVTAQIHIEEFSWDMGGESRTGEQQYPSAVPGSAEVPAAIHTYAIPAEVVVVHETLWTGTAVITGPGLPVAGVVIDLGEAVLATARAYDVIEVRTPLVRG